MSINEMERKVEQYNEWSELLEQAKKEVERLKAEITSEMIDRDTEELQAGKFIVRYTLVVSNRFDTTNFKKDFADVYKEYTKEITSRRFSIG